MDSSRPTTRTPLITDPAARERLYGQSDHVRLYGRDYFDRLARAGFTVHLDRLADDVGEQGRQRYGLLHEDSITCSVAPASGAHLHEGV